MIARRRFMSGVGAAVFLPLTCHAQSSGKLWRIGYLDQGSAAGNARYFEAFRRGLRDRGWSEGRDIGFEPRFAEGNTGQLPGLAADLVRLNVDIIATWTTPAALAAKRATSTIPIVIGFVAEPVASGIVTSLSRPGANITGWTHLGVELRAKSLELLKEAIPQARRLGVLWNPSNQVHQLSLQGIEPAAVRLNVELHSLGVDEPTNLDSAFSQFVAKEVQGLAVLPDGMFLAHARRIIALAARSRLPAVYGVREYAEAGGLMAYGANLAEMNRHLTASFVDKLLKGAKPADLPIEQPTTYELVINLKTAKALALTIPASLRVRADAVIE